jgi:DeoR/GlpR family transcriptional regulator of sugar metabolism
VATHDVLAGSSPACVAALSALTALITDRPVPRHVAAALHRADVAIHVARDE